MAWTEANFDGLVGPTHNYAGLSYGNIASSSNEGLASNPRGGALEGLSKMESLSQMGLVQGLLPPHDRPHLSTLRQLGFTGSDKEIITKVAAECPQLLLNVSSASTMWTANAATVSPRPDTADGRTHFTAANLAAMYHRSIEGETTARILRRIFPEGDRFAHHDPLPGGIHMGDEGAANHNRFCADYGDTGTALFVYGRRAFETAKDLNFPGRQTLEASQAIARQHGLDPARTVFVRQNPAAINAGAFHNDVVAVANGNVFFYHELAFEDPNGLEQALLAASPGLDLKFVRVPDAEVPIRDAVKSYLFNSMLIAVPGSNAMTLILPMEVAETPSTKAYVEALTAGEGPIGNAIYVDVRQSMRNGGGPACLRLRVAMDEIDQKSLGARVLMDPSLLDDLREFVSRRYRDRLVADDLRDPEFAVEVMETMDELTQILKLGSIYDFQHH